MSDYEAETIAMIRNAGSRLNRKSDTSLAEMYRQWSGLTSCAGWLAPSPSGIASFVAWAITAPCDEYEDAMVGDNEVRTA